MRAQSHDLLRESPLRLRRVCASTRFLSSAEFPRSRPSNSLAFKGGLLVTAAAAIPELSRLRGEEGVRVCGEKSLSDPFAWKPSSQSCVSATLAGLSSFLLLPSLAARCPPPPAPSYGLEGSGAVRTLNLFFMHSRERESEQECCRQDTSGPFLTTFHEFKSPVLRDAKAMAEKGVGEGSGKGVC